MILIILFSCLGKILSKVTTKNKSQRNFLEELFSLLSSMRGRVNFTNMSRFSKFNEVTFRRNFKKAFDWLSFNKELIDLANNPEEEMIVAIDASFIPKSGKNTYGFDRFWSGCANATKKGLEITCLALINIVTGAAWVLDVAQTPGGLSSSEGNSEDYTRVDFYMKQLKKSLDALTKVVYVVADGYYAKTKVFDEILNMDKHLITKLRSDANMRYVLDRTLHPDAHGNRKYDGKVNWSKIDLKKWEYAGVHPEDEKVKVYRRVLYGVHFKRELNVVLLLNTKTNQYVLLASTDLAQGAMEIVKFYALRFQIEFLFRDAKQFTGLTHCQSRQKECLHYHFNMSMAAINVYQLEMQQEDGEHKSINTLIRKAYNRRIVKMLLDELNSRPELGLNLDINAPEIQRIINLGQVTYKKSA